MGCSAAAEGLKRMSCSLSSVAISLVLMPIGASDHVLVLGSSAKIVEESLVSLLQSLHSIRMRSSRGSHQQDSNSLPPSSGGGIRKVCARSAVPWAKRKTVKPPLLFITKKKGGSSTTSS